MMNPVLFNIPEIIKTNRIEMHCPLFGEGDVVNHAIRESINELRPWMTWAQNVPTIEESELDVRRARLKFLEGSDLRFHLIHKETDKFIGVSGLHRINWLVKKFEIGYWVGTSWGGMGYITEAVDVLTNYCIDNFDANRIEIRCDPRNVKSIRIAEKLNFTLEAQLRSDMIDSKGTLRDTLVFSKVRGIEFK